MGNSIKPHIEHAEKTGACNLGTQGLTEFPEALGRLTKNLRTLDLSNNKLVSLPPAIGQFTMLKVINVSGNRLGTVYRGIPAEVGKLKKLETLVANKNRLSTLPPTLSSLSALRDINLANNALKEFPAMLVGLKHLDSINLSGNQLTAVPDEVAGIEAIEINLNQNQISHLSEHVAESPRLKVLRLEENCLELVCFTPHILKDSSISLLAVEGNLFDMKAFHNLEGYEEYMERYTATKKKIN